MKYACLVYQERQAILDVDAAELETVHAECGAWVDNLEKTGRHVFSTGLQSTSNATTLRNRDGKVMVTDGPFAETKEYLAGLTILDARDLNDAIQIASTLAAARTGSVEVRPLLSPDSEVSDPVDRKIVDTLRRAKFAKHEA